MPFELSSAVVVDDALGAPPAGTIAVEDKDEWVEFITEGTPADAALREFLYADMPSRDQPLFNEMIEEVISNHDVMTRLWDGYQNEKIVDAGLDILFRTANNLQIGRGDKALIVVKKLREICGAKNVETFSDLDSAATALARADIAFIDFYLKVGEGTDAAIARIQNAKKSLKGPKLLFFMSSLASLETQSEVKQEIGVKAAFFDVMNKTHITPEFIQRKISAKRDSFDANMALVGVTDALVNATTEALSEFRLGCDELEVHDLRLLDLARLDVEGEPLPEYLTWLFSETIAAKIRRNALPIALKENIKSDDVGFTGQIQQGEALFNFFSEIVLGPPVPVGSSIRFGELLTKVSDGKYYMALTPACDLQRCDHAKSVLCVTAKATVCDSFKKLAEQKLYGKLGDGKVCHLHWEAKDGKQIYTLLDWKLDEINTFTVGELRGKDFNRVARMNEIFAHEVKEEVLRNLGRVGTQINPSPTITLTAQLQWMMNNQKRQLVVPMDQFVPALLTYREYREEGKSSNKTGQTVVLSDEFRTWAAQKITESFGGESLSSKMSNCLKTIETKSKYDLQGKFTWNDNDLTIKALRSSEITEISRGLVEIDLIFPELKASEEDN